MIIVNANHFSRNLAISYETVCWSVFWKFIATMLDVFPKYPTKAVLKCVTIIQS